MPLRSKYRKSIKNLWHFTLFIHKKRAIYKNLSHCFVACIDLMLGSIQT
ncbi:hypothetical protein HFN_0972 [Helicobacter fennelliae MRY12-0050]|uniref:Uncharacterized protein n=1 Tax=Helicobacter fennelliae MRY12-0050 TaxID=1325130 RepID=T1DWU9_9HELI|nr:hypothetical protein HFN_0972 [Helicobacter fennelliae MRY12-0050]